MELNKLFLAMMAASSLALTACGGDSGSSGDSPDTSKPDAQVLTGTAATGLAIDGTVYVYDAEGRSANVVIADDGTFSVNVEGMTPPFMLEARPDDQSLAIQYSFAEAADINVNVTPLTTLALFLANDQQSLAALVDAWDAEAESFDATALAAVEETIRANFADQFEQQSIDPATYDLFNAVFSADQTGFDAVLDDVKIVVDMDAGTFDVDVDEADYNFNQEVEFGDNGAVVDTVPDSISFAAQLDVNPNEDAFSEVVTVAGFDGDATVAITNGQFQINKDGWVTAATITAGDTLRLRQAVPNAFETTTATTVSINGHDYTFSTTTRAADVTPNSFGFSARTGVEPSSTVTSHQATLAGFDGQLTLSVSNGSLLVNGTAAGTSAAVSAGDKIQVVQTSAAGFGASVTSNVTLGSVATTFVSTTRAADVTPNNFGFSARTGVEPSSTVTSHQATLAGFDGQLTLSVSNGTLLVNGTAAGTSAAVSAGDKVQVVQTSAAGFGASVTSGVTLGNVATTFVSTTRAADVTPNSFSFTTNTDVDPKVASYSNIVTLSGFDGQLPISVTKKAGLIINGGTRVGAANVSAGDTLQVVQDVTGDFGSNVVTTVILGSYSTTFTSTIRDADISPDTFNLTNLTDAEPDTSLESNTVTLAGFEGALTLTVSNGELRVNGDLSGASASVYPGDEISVVQQTSSDFEATVISTVTLGDFSTRFTTTTRETKTDVDYFIFAKQTGLEPGVVVTSDPVTLSGFDSVQTMNVVAGTGTIIVNGVDKGQAAQVSRGDAVQITQKSHANFSYSVITRVELNNVKTWFVAETRAANTIPAPFSFVSAADVEPGVEVVSEAISFSGLEASTRIQVTNGAVRSSRYPGQTLTSLAVWPGDSLTVVHTSSSQYGTDVVTTVSTLEGYGAVSATFTSTTRMPASNQSDPIMDMSWSLGQDSMKALNLAVRPESNGTELYMLKSNDSTSSLMSVTPGSTEREFVEQQALSSADYQGLAVALLEQGTTSEELIFSCDTATETAVLTARLASNPTAVSRLELSDTVDARLGGRASSLEEGMPWSVGVCDDLSIADVIYNSNDDTFTIKVGVSGAGMMNTSRYHQMAVFEYRYDLNAADASTAMTKTLATPVYRIMYGYQEYKAVEFFLDDPRVYRSFAVFKNNGSNQHNYLRAYDGGGGSVDLIITPFNKFTGQEGVWDVADMHVWMESETAYHLYLTSDTMGLYEVVYNPVNDTKTSERLHTAGDQQYCTGSITGSVTGANPTFWCHDATDEGNLIEFGASSGRSAQLGSATRQAVSEQTVTEQAELKRKDSSKGEGASKEEAEQIKAELEGAGAEVEVK